MSEFFLHGPGPTVTEGIGIILFIIPSIIRAA
jgi:hypothetical protein